MLSFSRSLIAAFAAGPCAQPLDRRAADFLVPVPQQRPQHPSDRGRAARRAPRAGGDPAIAQVGRFQPSAEERRRLGADACDQFLGLFRIFLGLSAPAAVVEKRLDHRPKVRLAGPLLRDQFLQGRQGGGALVPILAPQLFGQLGQQLRVKGMGTSPLSGSPHVGAAACRCASAGERRGNLPRGAVADDAHARTDETGDDQQSERDLRAGQEESSHRAATATARPESAASMRQRRRPERPRPPAAPTRPPRPAGPRGLGR